VSLIKSVSGIRGIIGGVAGENLTPVDIISFVSAYGHFLKKETEAPTVAIGRDGRISGLLVKNLAISTLQSLGINVIDLDYSTTPSVEMYVKSAGADGGIIITASHNPAEWNALKFLNGLGEFISQEMGEAVKQMAESREQGMVYSDAFHLGKVVVAHDAIQKHVDAILAHPLIDASLIRKAGFTAVADTINSTGSISIPVLLEVLGVKVTLINGDVTGNFAHNPEPLPEHLTELCQAVMDQKADIGISTDPDVDRLALVDEHGKFFGEEYTLVCAADYVLQHKKGPVVSNLSSSLALRDLAETYGVACHYAPVGEVHVVKKMKEVQAVIGGEGNGGVIDPELHYGRDALIGIALILMHLSSSKKTLSQLKQKYSSYVMVKDKIKFDPSKSAQALLDKVAAHFKSYELDVQDGLKVMLPDSWVQLRKSNTEPIIRIYSEAKTPEAAKVLVEEVKSLL
jgi:phosphomannomutase